MPAIVKRIDDKYLIEVDETGMLEMLNTIKIPKNLHYLTERLPNPNYEPLKLKKVDKNRFMQTLAGTKESNGPLVANVNDYL